MNPRVGNPKNGLGVSPVFVCVLLCAVVACCSAAGSLPATGRASAAAQATARSISFKHDIQTIFSAHCEPCHLGGGISGGLDLSSYAGLRQGGDIVPGPVFKPRRHSESLLWRMVQPKGPWPGDNRMPFGGPYLPKNEIATIAAWIDQGAKNN